MATKARPKKGAVKETAYQKRVRRFQELHPGATRQQARGHRRKEHVERREREVALGITTYQRGQLRAFAAAIEKRTGDDADEVLAILQQRVIEHSYEEIRDDVMGTVKRLQRMQRTSWKKRVVDISGRGERAGEMQDIADLYDIPFSWLFYGSRK